MISNCRVAGLVGGGATAHSPDFKGIDFKIENDKTLSCIPNYLLPIDDLKFIKE